MEDALKLPTFDEKTLEPNQLDPELQAAVDSQPTVPGPKPRDPDLIEPEIVAATATAATVRKPNRGAVAAAVSALMLIVGLVVLGGKRA